MCVYIYIYNLRNVEMFSSNEDGDEIGLEGELFVSGGSYFLLAP